MQTTVIPITTRVVILCGPSSQGKSTTASRMKEKIKGTNAVISHYEIAQLVKKELSSFSIFFILPAEAAELIARRVQIKILDELSEKLKDSSINRIIIETPYYKLEDLEEFLKAVHEVNTTVTLLKFNIPELQNLEWAKLHYTNLSVEQLDILIKEQREIYESPYYGSLNNSFPDLVDFEYIIEDLSKIEFS